MMKRILMLCMAALAAAGTPAIASADFKATKKMVIAGGGSGSEFTEYIKGNRTRTEVTAGGRVIGVTLQQCDLKRTVQLNDATKKYMILAGEGASPMTPPSGAAAPAKKGGVVTMTTTLTDTGERKEIHGMTARHIKTTIVTEPSANACNQSRTKIETDGWYVDLEGYGDGCDQMAASSMAGMGAGGCQDEVRTKTVGTAKLGYAVLFTISSGEETQMPPTTFEIGEISREPLDASLFEIPAGYTEVKSFAELMAP
jgi:hypothetical protein